MNMFQSMNIRILKYVATIIADRYFFNMQERSRSLFFQCKHSVSEQPETALSVAYWR